MKPNETLSDITIRDVMIYPVGLLADLARFIHDPDRPAARRHLHRDPRDAA